MILDLNREDMSSQPRDREFIVVIVWNSFHLICNKWAKIINARYSISQFRVLGGVSRIHLSCVRDIRVKTVPRLQLSMNRSGRRRTDVDWSWAVRWLMDDLAMIGQVSII